MKQIGKMRLCHVYKQFAYNVTLVIRFKKAFEDPKFREMFAEYMNEIQDPKYREETEAYISQLEGEDKVPEGKELIRPVACFVAKTYKVSSEYKSSNNSDDKEKIFVNIVQSDRIAKPTSTKGAEGSHWQIPYSVGPLRMEKDKKESNAATFDVCFHPEAIVLSLRHKQFQTVVVETAIDGIEAAYQKQKQNTKLSRDFHIIKNVTYKSGQVVTMMINKSDTKSSWSDDTSTNTESVTVSNVSNSGTNGTKANDDAAANNVDTKLKAGTEGSGPNPGSKHSTVVKKGFLNNQKNYVYDEELKKKNESSSVSNKLVQELPSNYKPVSKSAPISSVSKEETLLKPVSTSAKSKSSTTVPGATTSEDNRKNNKEPEYTMKERGVLSMGDFEGMRGNNKVASNRPAELIYKFDVPLATKPSLLNLDVSERLLKLSYPDVYDVSLSMPYPVFDKKGTAKYDKASKSLTVTLPVQPHQQLIINTPPTSSTLNNGNDEEVSSDHSTTNTKTTQKGSNIGSHARWVSSDVTDEAKQKNDALKSDILKKAEEAIKLYEIEADTVKSVPQPSIVNTPKNNIPPVISTHPLLESNDNFIPSSGYVGSKSGYVFKTGSKGLGYYVDSKDAISSDSIISTSSSSSTRGSVDNLSGSNNNSNTTIPYTARQNISTLAIIIDIKNIDKSATEVIYNESKLDVHIKDSTGKVFEIGFDIVGGTIDNRQSSHDIAPENMAIILVKTKEQYWAEPINNSNCSTILIKREFKKTSTPISSISDKTTPLVKEPSIISTMNFSASVLYELD